MYGLANCFFKEEDDRDYAIQQLNSLRSNPTAHAARVQAEGPVTAYPSKERDKERKIAHSVSQRFRDEEKFFGKLSEDVIENLKTCEEASVGYKLSEARVLQYLHNLLDGEPK